MLYLNFYDNFYIFLIGGVGVGKFLFIYCIYYMVNKLFYKICEILDDVIIFKVVYIGKVVLNING